MTAQVKRSGAMRRAVGSTLRLAHYNLKLLFGRHWWMYLLGLSLWFGWLVLRVVVGWAEAPWGPADVQNGVLSVPLLILAIYLGMSSFAMEIEERTIEGLFTVSGNRYRPFIVRIATGVAFLMVAAFFLSGLAWTFLTAFPIVVVTLNAMAPVLLYFALALTFSVLFKGAIPAGLTVAPLLALNVVLAGPTHGTRYNVFFNYLDRPVGADEVEWLIMAVQNRMALVVAIGLLLFYTVRLTDKRERLL